MKHLLIGLFLLCAACSPIAEMPTGRSFTAGEYQAGGILAPKDIYGGGYRLDKPRDESCVVIVSKFREKDAATPIEFSSSIITIIALYPRERYEKVLMVPNDHWVQAVGECTWTHMFPKG